MSRLYLLLLLSAIFMSKAMGEWVATAFGYIFLIWAWVVALKER